MKRWIVLGTLLLLSGLLTLVGCPSQKTGAAGPAKTAPEAKTTPASKTGTAETKTVTLEITGMT